MDFVAGCIGGCAGVLVGHPFDTVKVRLQTQDPLNPKYRGTFHCFTSTLKAESVKGLFRGMSSPLLGVSAVNAIVFGVYGNIQKNSADPGALSTHFYAGLAAGTVQSFITGPLELVKTRLQLQDESSKPLRTLQTYKMAKPAYAGPVDCIRQMMSNEGGVLSLTKGLGATLLRDGPALAAYFVSYEYFTTSRLFRADPCSDLSTASLLMAGGLAGVVSWVVSYPMDIVKSRIQSNSASKGLLQSAKDIHKVEGLRGFFRGINSAIIRAYPTNAAIFFTVHLTFKLHERYSSNGKANAFLPDLFEAEERLVETVQQRVYYHLHYHNLVERMHFHTIPNHL